MKAKPLGDGAAAYRSVLDAAWLSVLQRVRLCVDCQAALTSAASERTPDRIRGPGAAAFQGSEHVPRAEGCPNAIRQARVINTQV
jgi:hypothetical protein